MYQEYQFRERVHCITYFCWRTEILPGKHSLDVLVHNERLSRRIHSLCQQYQCIFEDHPVENDLIFDETLPVHQAFEYVTVM